MKTIIGSAIVVSLLMSAPLAAKCYRVTNVKDLSTAAVNAGYTAADWSGAYDDQVQGSLGLPGVISLSNAAEFQPSGTLLASSVASFVPHGRTGGYGARQVLFRCQLSDRGALYEYYSTNGDDDRGGKQLSAEVSNAYYTDIKNLALRLTNLKTGQPYSRYWQRRPLAEDDLFSDENWIYVPAAAFSDVLVELFRIDDTRYATNGSAWFQYGYAGPAGYVAFQGGGLSSGLFDGADHASNYNGWADKWPGGWSLKRNVTVVRGAACRVADYPAIVELPAITAGGLAAGQHSQAPFTLSVECQRGANSSTAPSTAHSANVAMGLKVASAHAANEATRLGLTSGGGGLSWLLDNQYGNPNRAAGVGIRIYSERLGHQPINLLAPGALTGSGNQGGWYGWKDLTDLQADGAVETYRGEFMASLEAIPGQPITPGEVYAQLQVVVSFQ